MEAAPPSYSEATSTKPWKFVAEYLQTQELCSAVLTCREWHEGFLFALWGNPTSHFASRDESIYSTLARFRRVLPRVHRSVRVLVHTLDLPRASSDYDYSPRPEWLRDIVFYLPNLQSLVISGLSFVDHGSIMSLARIGSSPSTASYGKSLGTNLRLMRISDCKNATPAALAAIIETVPLLVYLDLGGTSAARDPMVLSQLPSLQMLRILNLRGIALKDKDLETVAKSTGRRLRCLDVRNNRLTSESTDTFLQMLRDTVELPQSLPSYQMSNRTRQQFTRKWCDEGLERQIYQSLTTSLGNHLVMDDADDIGLTHLRIGKNGLTLTAISLLLKCNKLNVLDAGELSMPHSLGLSNADSSLAISANICVNSLRYLRVHHGVVTAASQESGNRALNPSQMRNLDALVLTAVPPKAPNNRISQRLIDFLKDCAQESQIAQLQARLDYTLPPSRSDQVNAWKSHARRLFALRQISLEMAPPKTIGAPNAKAEGWNYYGNSRSVTEDKDSESFWRATASDFSFFGSEDQHSLLDEHSSPTEQELTHDVVAAIASFRKSCKNQYDRALARGETLPKIDGYWDGEIKIVRNSSY